MSTFDDYGGALAAPTPRTCIADRYELGRVLGSGSFGVVHEAIDRLTSEVVAVKLLRSTGLRRREAAALRGLELPGVVRLLDEGEEGGVGFLVMQRVSGTPFPPEPGPTGGEWEALRPGFDALLRTLEAIHARGGVHLDLKPSNLLMGEDGRLFVLDFGLAAFSPVSGGVGNRRYAAPEQLDGGPVDRRADLYAVGVLLWEALTGAHPCEGTSHPRPPGVHAALRAMLARRPADRPATAGDARTRLIGREPPLPLPAPLAPPTLRGLFVGPERILHLPSDAAALAWSRGSGDEAGVRDEIESWIGTGLARREGDRVAVSRESLDRLERRVEIPMRGDHVDVAALMVRMDEEIARGRIAAARSLAEHGFASCISQSGRLDIAGRWTELAVGEGRRAALDPVLHALGALPESSEVQLLEGLCRAALLLAEGSGARALSLLAGLPPATGSLELCRLRLRVQASGRIGPAAEEAELEALRTSGARLPDGRLDAWLGRLRYAQGRFAEAATLQTRASEAATSAVSRVSCLLNASSAWLEVGHAREGLTRAETALELARAGRMVHHEGRAEWLLRAHAYRRGTADRVDHELVEAAVASAIPYLVGLVALNEAAVAWRIGEDPRDLARVAGEAWRREGRLEAVALCAALGAASGDGRPEDVWALVDGLPATDVTWQVLGVLTLRWPTGPWADPARVHAGRAPRPDLRRDVLSPREVLGGFLLTDGADGDMRG